MIPILDFRNWYCPNCGLTEQSRGQPNRWHNCPKLRGLMAPLILEGTKAKVEAHEREDYEGEDAGYTQKDENGRPVMSIETTRDEGTDLAVLAPTAHGGIN